VPADGVAVPADGIAVSPNGVIVPADRVAVPADGVAVPADGVAVPADGVAIPADRVVDACPCVVFPKRVAGYGLFKVYVRAGQLQRHLCTTIMSHRTGPDWTGPDQTRPDPKVPGSITGATRFSE
jgi:hypothetical protein